MNLDRKKELDLLYLIMEINIKGTGRMTPFLEMELISNIKTNLYIKESFTIGKSKVKESLSRIAT